MPAYKAQHSCTGPPSSTPTALTAYRKQQPTGWRGKTKGRYFTGRKNMNSTEWMVPSTQQFFKHWILKGPVSENNTPVSRGSTPFNYQEKQRCNCDSCTSHGCKSCSRLVWKRLWGWDSYLHFGVFSARSKSFSQPFEVLNTIWYVYVTFRKHVLLITLLVEL